MQHFIILSGSRQKFLAALLIQPDSVKLILAYVPPSRHDGAGQKARYQLSPDQGLHALRRDEILLCGGKPVGSTGWRSQQVSASARRGASSYRLGRLPNSRRRGHCTARTI